MAILRLCADLFLHAVASPFYFLLISVLGTVSARNVGNEEQGVQQQLGEPVWEVHESAVSHLAAAPGSILLEVSSTSVGVAPPAGRLAFFGMLTSSNSDDLCWQNRVRAPVNLFTERDLPAVVATSVIATMHA